MINNPLGLRGILRYQKTFENGFSNPVWILHSTPVRMRKSCEDSQILCGFLNPVRTLKSCEDSQILCGFQGRFSNPLRILTSCDDSHMLWKFSNPVRILKSCEDH
jgi:hypothetical protein